jgi:hypothetical protein
VKDGAWSSNPELEKALRLQWRSRTCCCEGKEEGAVLMPREAKIDRAIYLVNDEQRTYKFLRRNPDWRKLRPEENEANKRSIEGYAREMRSGKSKTYRRAEHP